MIQIKTNFELLNKFFGLILFWNDLLAKKYSGGLWDYQVAGVARFSNGMHHKQGTQNVASPKLRAEQKVLSSNIAALSKI